MGKKDRNEKKRDKIKKIEIVLRKQTLFSTNSYYCFPEAILSCQLSNRKSSELVTDPCRTWNQDRLKVWQEFELIWEPNQVWCVTCLFLRFWHKLCDSRNVLLSKIRRLFFLHLDLVRSRDKVQELQAEEYDGE